MTPPRLDSGARPHSGIRVPQSAFTLIELLVVIAIIVMLTFLVAPAMTALSKSNSLSNGGRVLSNLLTTARTQAINQRTIVRLEIATVWPLDASQNFRKVTIAQYDLASSSFKQVSGWETLPQPIVIEPKDVYATPPADIDPSPTPTPGRGTYFVDLFTPTGSLNLDASCSIAGQPVSCAYFEFLPTGALNTAVSPVWLRLAVGVVNGANVTHTARGRNYADVVVDNLVGRIVYSRP
jgi:prepilin-type N-terminal cleavage/methylation domain-containing protein